MIKVTVKKISSVTKSVVSTYTQDPVTNETAEKRLNSCQNCEFFIASKTHPDKHICGRCGCGERKILEDAIIEYPYLECPLGMPGFSNEGHPWSKE